MSILDGVIITGLILVCWLLTLFIRDDLSEPKVPRSEIHAPEIGTDDDLDLSWSQGTGDWR